jgi:predicted transposase/invertase (TIGR01784 family)
MTKVTEKKSSKKSRAHEAEKLTSPFDRVFRQWFGERTTVKSFLRQNLPKAITKKMDFRTLRISKDTFIDKNLSDFRSDILYEIKYRKKTAFVYLLFEHKSKQEKFMLFQLLKYMVRIWELYLMQNKSPKHLPVIIPLVIYHGLEEWNRDIDFKGLFGETEDVEAYIPDFKCALYDISHIPESEIKGDVLLRIALTILKYSHDPDLWHKLPGIIRLFNEISSKTRASEYLESLIRYVLGTRNYNVDEFREMITEVLEEGGAIMLTTADRLKQEGIDIGMKKGKEEGKEEGKKEGKKEVAIKLLMENVPMETITKCTGLPADEIKKLVN